MTENVEERGRVQIHFLLFSAMQWWDDAFCSVCNWHCSLIPSYYILKYCFVSYILLSRLSESFSYSFCRVTQQFSKNTLSLSTKPKRLFCFFPHQPIKTNGFTPRFTNLRLWNRKSPLWFLNMVWRLKQEQWTIIMAENVFKKVSKRSL